MAPFARRRATTRGVEGRDVHGKRDVAVRGGAHVLRVEWVFERGDDAVHRHRGEIGLTSVLRVEFGGTFEGIGLLAELLAHRGCACGQRPGRRMCIEGAFAGDRSFAADVQCLEGIELPRLRDADAHPRLRHHTRIRDRAFHAAVVERLATVLFEVWGISSTPSSCWSGTSSARRRACSRWPARRERRRRSRGWCRRRYRHARDPGTPARSPGTSSVQRGWRRGCCRWSLLRSRRVPRLPPLALQPPAVSMAYRTPANSTRQTEHGPQPSVPLSSSTNQPTTTRRTTNRIWAAGAAGHRNLQNVQMKCVDAGQCAAGVAHPSTDMNGAAAPGAELFGFRLRRNSFRRPQQTSSGCCG